jgi:hypothetical protein
VVNGEIHWPPIEMGGMKSIILQLKNTILAVNPHWISVAAAFGVTIFVTIGQWPR